MNLKEQIRIIEKAIRDIDTLNTTISGLCWDEEHDPSKFYDRIESAYGEAEGYLEGWLEETKDREYAEYYKKRQTAISNGLMLYMLDCESSSGGGHQRYSDDRHLFSKPFKTLDSAKEYAKNHYKEDFGTLNCDMFIHDWKDYERGKWSLNSSNRIYTIKEVILGDNEVEEKKKTKRHGMMAMGTKKGFD